ncbi:mannitol dehydrogenase family protein [Sphingobacterium paludis]|uniref:Mannitol 2-dehydrogenase n=1 Tax=Sphingobacterium paludis TaxID=1476465 RepID=A0A4R7CT02_9SPHI|nr:mannitol dehydrogenase family protein [Sphingobacterium paludis]TDS09751.1 mannitol 2-dehydrogenase [Sphingobacterium paludis]
MGNQHNFDGERMNCGILHIGVGNFHRAHQAFFINQLLRDEDQANWGICGVCLLASDKNTFQNLTAQNLRYTLTVCGRDGRDELHEIEAIKELLWAVEQPDAVLDKIADPAIKIITLTITEGGYNLDKSTQSFIWDNETVEHDLKRPSAPKTIFGFIAEGLRRRREKQVGGLTILSCDNLQHNGDAAKQAFTTFIAEQDEDLFHWVRDHVSFPNSMVDRITPTTTAQDVERLNKKSGIADKAPVYCEDFIQWVIEDNFIAGRPALERVGVEFTDNVEPFENMKLSLLNASHTLLSYPSMLKGYRKVDQAMQDEDIRAFIKTFMDLDITPHVPAPKGTDLEEYKQTLVERFGNKSVSDQVSRLCGDGLSKFPVYIVPNLKKMIAAGQDLSRVAILIAAYRHYLAYLKDDTGSSYEINEPWLTQQDLDLIKDENPLAFLAIPPFKHLNLADEKGFAEHYVNYVKRIKNEGMGTVLANQSLSH